MPDVTFEQVLKLWCFKVVFSKIWVTLFLTAPLAISCNCRHTLTSSLRVHVEAELCRLCDVSQSPVSFFSTLSCLLLWTCACIWTVVTWMLNFLRALIRHCNSQEMKSIHCGQTQLQVSLWCFLHPPSGQTNTCWRKRRHKWFSEGKVATDT